MSNGSFVGRVAQLAQLRAWVDEAGATGIGRFVLVVGEAGAGKTRFCCELSNQLAAQNAAVAWSRCWVEGGGPPLWPWPDLVAELGYQTGQAPEPARGTESLDRFGLFRTISDQLRALCLDRPCVAVIDDLHAANQDVALLTRFVARSLHRYPLVLVATWRAQRVTTTEAHDELVAMASEASIVDLPPFGADDVAAYLQICGRDSVDDDEIACLLASTDGNPMYLAELVRHPSTDGASRRGLALALANRVSTLGVAERQILGAAALLGAGASVAETAEIVGCSPDDVIDTVHDRASGAALVGDEIRFSHDLLRDAFAAALHDGQRQAFHAAAIDAIRGGELVDVVRRARHAVHAASLSTVHTMSGIAACREATQALQKSLAFEQAVEWASKASALALESSGRAPEAELRLAHADAVLACGRLNDARELYAMAVKPAEEAGDPRALARAALGMGGIWVEEQRDEVSRRTMLGLCRRAMAALPPDEPVLAARLAVRLAAEAAYDGGAVDDVAAAVADVRRLGDGPALAEALSLYHHTLLLPIHSECRLRVAEELLDVAANSEAPNYSLQGLCWRTVDLYLLGDARAERAFIDLRERATALGSQSIGYIVAVLDVMRTFRGGDLDKAESLAEEALALGQAAGDADAFAYYGAHLLAIRWVQGRLGEMVELISAVMDSSTLRRRDAIYPAVLAYSMALRGDLLGARSVVDGLLADGVQSIPNFSTWTGSIGALVETAAELGDGEVATQLADAFAPTAHLPVMPSLAVACLGPGERVLGTAYATAQRWDEAIGWYRAALRANRRLRSRPFDAIIRAELAAALRRRAGEGDAAEAADLYASAVDLGAELGLAERVRQWRAAAATAGPSTSQPVAAVNGTLERRDRDWWIDIDGRSTSIGDLVGVRFIAELLTQPDTDVSANALSAAVDAVEPLEVGACADTILDAQGRSEYQRRLRELDRELDMADLAGDVGRGRRAAEERDSLLDALRRASGLGGRPRRFSDDSERSRMRVSKAIGRALTRLSATDAVLGRALDSRIRTGYVCRYDTDPGRPIVWTVSKRT